MDCVTILEILKTLRDQYPNTTEEILRHVDLSDEAFEEILEELEKQAA